MGQSKSKTLKDKTGNVGRLRELDGNIQFTSPVIEEADIDLRT